MRQVGDQFVVHMDRQALNDGAIVNGRPLGRYDVTVIITRFEQNAALEWMISGTVQPPIRHLYGYQLEPSETGTLVTSYYDWSQIAEQYRGKIGFPVIPEAALRATLGILARTVDKLIRLAAVRALEAGQKRGHGQPQPVDLGTGIRHLTRLPLPSSSRTRTWHWLVTGRSRCR